MSNIIAYNNFKSTKKNNVLRQDKSIENLLFLP